MRLRHIEVFQAVYTSGSTTEAAKLLNVSQPSVSKVLSHAELQLGFPLFDRVKGKLVPTPEAKRLYDHVETLFDELGTLRRTASNLKEASEGRIRIASTPALGIDLLPKIVAGYMAAQPGVRFDLETLHQSEMIDALRESRLDLALAFDPPKIPGIQVENLGLAKFVLLSPPGLLKQNRKRFRLSELTGTPFISLNNRSPLGRLLDAHMNSVGVEFNVVASAETYHLAGALVSQGAGIAIVDEITADTFRNDEVERFDIEPKLGFQICLMQIDHVPVSQVSQKFAKHLERSLKDRFN